MGAFHEWMAFLDTDEFLVLQPSAPARTLPEFLAGFAASGGLVVNWRVFGAATARGGALQRHIRYEMGSRASLSDAAFAHPGRLLNPLVLLRQVLAGAARQEPARAHAGAHRAGAGATRAVGAQHEVQGGFHGGGRVRRRGSRGAGDIHVRVCPSVPATCMCLADCLLLLTAALHPAV